MPKKRQFQYDVVFSFAGEDRLTVEPIAVSVRDRGVKVFYDKFEEANLWGKNIYEYLADLYSNHAKFCVIFISDSYKKKWWTNHERRSAQERALKENYEYILPVRLDDTEILGLPSTISYLDLREVTRQKISDAIISKVEVYNREKLVTNTEQPHIGKSELGNKLRISVRVSHSLDEHTSLSELQKAINKAKYGIIFPEDYNFVIRYPFSLKTYLKRVKEGLLFHAQIPSQLKPLSEIKREEELRVWTNGFVQLTHNYSFEANRKPQFALELYIKQIFFTLHFSERLLITLGKKPDDITVAIEAYVPLGACLSTQTNLVDTKNQVAYFATGEVIQKERSFTIRELQSKTKLIQNLSNVILDGFEYIDGQNGPGIPLLEDEAVERITEILKSRVQ